jgi:low affinity Fe/Cu permease
LLDNRVPRLSAKCYEAEAIAFKAGILMSAPSPALQTPNGSTISRAFASAANTVARAAGRPSAFALAVLAIVVWLVVGPFYRYSDTWQLVINTGTTIVTFLMVFLIQNSQNRDNAAIQVKLDELIRASAAQNFYIGIEHLTDEEIDEIRKKCEMRGRAAQEVGDEATQQVGQKAARAADEATGL